MLDYDTARALALTTIERLGTEVGEALQLIESATIERPHVWVFFYNSKRYLETGDHSHALAGNGPLLVDTRSGELLRLGTAYPVQRYIEHYENTGQVL